MKVSSEVNLEIYEHGNYLEKKGNSELCYLNIPRTESKYNFTKKKKERAAIKYDLHSRGRLILL